MELIQELGPEVRETTFFEVGLSDLIVRLTVLFKDGNPPISIEKRGYVDQDRIHIHELDDRLIFVYLPPGYDESQTYPFLLAQDGQNLFSTGTSVPSGEWQMDETLDRLITENKCLPMIVAGISSGTDRVQAFWPQSFGYEMGQGEEYADWIMDTAVPFLEERYAISQETELRGVIGSSYGAVISLYLGLEYPDQFGFMGLISPAMDLGGQDAVIQADGIPGKVWIDSGSEEIYQIIALQPFSFPENARKLYTQFQDAGLQWPQDLILYLDPGATGHTEPVVAARLEYPLLFFGNSIPEDHQDDGQRIIWNKLDGTEVFINYTN